METIFTISLILTWSLKMKQLIMGHIGRNRGRVCAMTFSRSTEPLHIMQFSKNSKFWVLRTRIHHHDGDIVTIIQAVAWRCFDPRWTLVNLNIKRRLAV